MCISLVNVSHIRRYTQQSLDAAQNCIAGGLGLAAVQIVNAAGAQAIVTAGSLQKRKYLRDNGVQTALNSRSTEFADSLYHRFPNILPAVVLNSLTSPGMLHSCNVYSSCEKEGGKNDPV